MNEASRPTITWTREKAKTFAEAINRCKDETFTFEGHVFLVSYAKYLSEYLTQQFN